MWHSSSSSRRQTAGQSSSSGSGRHPIPPPPLPPPEPRNDNDRRNVSRRVVHGGRPIHLPGHQTTPFYQQLQRFGWENIPNYFVGQVCHPLVREFYSRLNFFYENGDRTRPAIVSRVAGQHIFLNTAQLANLLGIPNDGECIYFKKSRDHLKAALAGVEIEDHITFFLTDEYDRGKMEEKHLQPIFRDLNTFFEYDILPKSGTNNSISKFQGFLLYCFAINRKLNLPYIILMYIQNIIENETMGLGYGALLTHIFTHLGIPVNNWELTEPRMAIDQRTFNLRSSHPFRIPPVPEPANQAEPENQEEEEPEPEEQGEPQNQPHHEEPEDALARLGPDLYYAIRNNNWNIW